MIRHVVPLLRLGKPEGIAHSSHPSADSSSPLMKLGANSDDWGELTADHDTSHPVLASDRPLVEAFVGSLGLGAGCGSESRFFTQIAHVLCGQTWFARWPIKDFLVRMASTVLGRGRGLTAWTRRGCRNPALSQTKETWKGTMLPEAENSPSAGGSLHPANDMPSPSPSS